MRDRIRILAEGVVAALAAEAYASAVASVPVDTGALRESIRLECSGLSASVSASVPYAAYVELGTPARSPQPYLLPALRFAQGRISSIAGGLS